MEEDQLTEDGRPAVIEQESAYETAREKLLAVIDRNSPIPLYYQLAQGVERLVESAELPPGTRLDSEMDLSRYLRLSRPTVRRALSYLADRGVVARRRGTGTVVMPGIIRRPIGLTSLYDDLVQSGHRPTTKVLAFETVSCPPAVGTSLDIELGGDVLYLRRLRLVDDNPLAIMENYLPTDLVELDQHRLSDVGLYSILRASGVPPYIATQSIESRIAEPAEAELLEIAPGAPTLRLQRVSYEAGGRAIEHAVHIYAGERHVFQMNLVEHSSSGRE